MTRDLSQAQFDQKCREYGFERVGFAGYYKITETLSVSTLNAGPKRRSQLAYLIQQRDKEIKRAKLRAQMKPILESIGKQRAPEPESSADYENAINAWAKD